MLEDEKLTGVIITQFILLMQNEGVWPCSLSLGETPQQLTPEEVLALKDKYVALLNSRVPL